MKVVIRFLIIMFSLQVFSQNIPKETTKDTIMIGVSYRSYQKVAYDSVRNIYKNQKELIAVDKNFTNAKDAISRLYNFEELVCISIPTFKIKRTDVEFNEKSNFEDFIDFTQNFNFQEILIKNEGKIITRVDIPEFNFELARIYRGNPHYSYDKSDYESKVLKIFTNREISSTFKVVSTILESRSENFFFTIFGLRNLLFEIDKKTGYLYVSSVVPELKLNKIPVNDLIFKKVGIEKINDFAKNMYNLDKRYGFNKKRGKRKRIIFKVNESY